MQSQQNEKLLVVENLTMEYQSPKRFFEKQKPSVKAVNNVSFEVRTGETFGIVGESGCGKTTLGKCIVRLLTPSEGKLLFYEEGEAKDLLRLKSKESFELRKKLQIVFQDPYASLNPMHTILEALDEPMRVHGIGGGSKERRKELIAQALEMVNLQPEYMYRYPHEFSGGQRQRICVAKALVLEPKLIVCDEPVSALDVSIQAQLLNLMRKLQKELGATFIFIAHDLSVVQYMSDRIAVMYLGNIVELADADELYHTDLAIACHKEYGNHEAHSFIFWGDPEGLSDERKTVLPTTGPHGMCTVDPGNILDRGPKERYTSEVKALPEHTHVSRLTWCGVCTSTSWVEAEMRSADTETDIQTAAWKKVESGQDITDLALRGFVQYRLALCAKCACGTPRITKVEVEIEKDC